jgi:hypothetical protein
METVFFDEDVKGHRLLITSKLVLFKGRQLATEAIETISTAFFRQSVNLIPAGASYRVTLTAREAKIVVEFARMGGLRWGGAWQFKRARNAVTQAAGNRLVSEAIKELIDGKVLQFSGGNYALERETNIKVFADGILIEQTGTLFSNKSMPVRWEHLRTTVEDGTMFFECYSTQKKANFAVWRMPNNVVFMGLISFLMDKANYRMLIEE